jgi:hypothetical protein
LEILAQHKRNFGRVQIARIIRFMFVKHTLCMLFVAYAWSVKGQQHESISTDSVITTNTVDQSSKTKKDDRPVVKQISFGGSTAFWINLHSTHVEISPMIAYHFPKVVTIGGGYRYIYTRDRFYGKNLNTIGPNIFARAQITKRFYLWTEWEKLRTEYALEALNQEVVIQETTVHSFFSGLGYIRSVRKNGRGKISIQVLYNFLYDREDHSPYYSPVIYRVGYFF